jgi:UrcA family protein
MALNKIFITGAAVILGLPVLSGAALAQERVIVRPPITRYENPMPLKGGMKTETIMISHTVGYGDLDLSKRSDRAVLNRRIDFAARRACTELDAKFPPSVYVPVNDSGNCVGEARREALAMVDIRYRER